MLQWFPCHFAKCKNNGSYLQFLYPHDYICKTMSITKVHVNCNLKTICKKSLNLNGKLDIGRDTIKVTNKSYAYCWEELCSLQKNVENV